MSQPSRSQMKPTEMEHKRSLDISFMSIVLLMLIVAYVTSFFLLSLDKDVRSYGDLLYWKGIIVISYYAIPAFLISMLFFKRFSRNANKISSLMFSLLFGIPAGIILVIAFFKLIFFFF